MGSKIKCKCEIEKWKINKHNQWFGYGDGRKPKFNWYDNG